MLAIWLPLCLGMTAAGEIADPRPLELQAPEAARDFLQTSFTHMDRDGDGAITLAEAPTASRARRNADGELVQEGPSADLWMAGIDQNGDGRVTWSEFEEKLLPIVWAAGATPAPAQRPLMYGPAGPGTEMPAMTAGTRP